MSARTCAGPECPREASVGGLCRAHYRQSNRRPGQELRSLRIGAGLDETLPSTRVSAELLAALLRIADASGRTLAGVTREAIEAWTVGR